MVEFVGDDSHGPNAHGFGAGEAPDHARPAVPVTQLLQPRPHRSQGGGGQTADRDGEAAAQAEGGRAADAIAAPSQ